jgi:hypothetical protein
MNDRPSRRRFLKSTSAALAAGTAAAPARTALAAPDLASGPAAAAIPPHEPLPLEGLHAYTDRVSVEAGQVVRFYVSATHAYQFEVCRLGLNVDSPDGDQVLFSRTVDEPVMQPIHAGSYVHVERNLPNQPFRAFSAEIWVRLWDLPGEQVLFSQCDKTLSAGIVLAARRDGSLAYYLGDGGPWSEQFLHATGPGVVTRSESGPPAEPGINKIANGGRPVKLARWHHVVATFDGESKRLWVDGILAARFPFMGIARPGTAPLRIGAAGKEGRACNLLDADIAMPVLYARALSAEQIAQRYAQKALHAPRQGDELLACWPLDEESGARVADGSGQGRHGEIINHGTWMIGGPAFNANVERFGKYDPARDATRGHGLRLASDDLYDCRWKPTFEYRIPADARSGIFAGRFRFVRHGQPRLYHAIFVVKKPASRRPARIAFLCSTNTYRAYAGTPFAESWPGIDQTIGHAYINSPGQPPEFSFYWQHRAGQGSYQMGMRMPWPVAGPYTFHQDLEWRTSHLCHADRLALSWLEQEGYDVDVYADLDLHRHPNLLDGYQTLFIVGHSEYWSAEALAHLENYLRRGGTVVCLSGNTMFWRVSFSPDESVIECRKVDAPGAQLPPERRGEIWHSHDGQRGGMARECGYPAWRYLGLEYMSVHAVAGEGLGPYIVRAADHPFFKSPHDLALAPGDKLGGAPGGMPQLIGHEGDVRVSTLAKVCLQPVPQGGVQPEIDPPGITLLADGYADWSRIKEGAPWDYFQRGVVQEPQRTAVSVAAEMILWNRPHGGRIFHAGSVSSGRGLKNDPKFALMMKNVLHHFGVELPLHRQGGSKACIDSNDPALHVDGLPCGGS